MSGYANYNIVLNHSAKRTIQVVKGTNDFLQEHKLGRLYDLKEDAPCVIQDIESKQGDLIVVDKTSVSGTFVCRWEEDTLYCKNNAVESKEYTVCKLEDDYVFTRELNFHPDSSQTFYNYDSAPFFLILGTQITELFVLYFDGKSKVFIHPGVYHQPPIPAFKKTPVTFYTEQSRAHLCVVFDSITEYNQWLIFNYSFKRKRVLVVNASTEMKKGLFHYNFFSYQIFATPQAMNSLQNRVNLPPLVSSDFFVKEKVRSLPESVLDYGVLKRLKDNYFDVIIFHKNFSPDSPSEFFYDYVIWHYCKQHNVTSKIVRL